MRDRSSLKALLIAGILLPLVSCSTPPSLISITVTPNVMNYGGPGLTTQLTATGTYAQGSHPQTTLNITNQVSWVSAATQCVTVSNTGVITSGTITCSNIPVTASAPGFTGLISGSMTVNVSQSSAEEPLQSLAIVPAAQTVLAINQPVQFIAIGTLSSGATVDLTSSKWTVSKGEVISAAAWTSSNTAVAQFLPANAATPGLVTSEGAGSSTISASAMNPDGTVVSGSSILSVTAPVTNEPYVSMAIVPAAQTLSAVGQQAKFIAIGTTGTGATVDLTSQSNWSSSDGNGKIVTQVGNATPAVALLGGNIFAASGNGAVAITASYTITPATTTAPAIVITASASLTVNISAATEPLLSVSLLPASQSAPAGQATQFLAMGDFSATTPGPGMGTHPLPASSTATGNVYTYAVTWYSSNPAVATVCTTALGTTVPANCPTTPGLVTGVSAGTTAITAVVSGNPDGSVVTTTTTYTVTGPNPGAITGLSINPTAQSMNLPEVGLPNPTVYFVVIGANGAGQQFDETSAVSWTSSNPAVATFCYPTPLPTGITNPTICPAIVPSVLVVGVGPGTTNITATYKNTGTGASIETAFATLTVTGPGPEPLLSLTINPASPSVPFPTQTEQLTAIGTTATGATVDLTSTKYPVPGITPVVDVSAVKWTSSNPLVATVCTASALTNTTICPAPATPGLVNAIGQGTTAITATATNPDGSLVYTTTSFSVSGGSSQSMTALSIIPDSLNLSATGQAGSLIALGTSGSTGLQEDVTASTQIAWTSSNPTIATVSSALAPTQTCVVNATPPPAQTCTNDPAGTVKGVSAGSTNINAEYTNQAAVAGPPAVPAQVVTAQASVTVTTTPAAEPLLSIAVTPTTVTTINLYGTAQYIAFGSFSTAPTEMDITNGFYHAGFPNAGCTETYAAADAAAAAADTASDLPVNNLPYSECTFTSTNWVSLPTPFGFPIDSAGAPGAAGGLITADASGTEDVYAVAQNPDGTLVYSANDATFNCPYVAPTYATVTTTNQNTGITTTSYDYNDVLNIGSCNALTIGNGLLSTLTVFDASLNSTGLNQSNWLITTPDTTNSNTVIHCGPGSTTGGSVCEATYPNGTPLTVTAPKQTGVTFDGWSNNCSPCAPGAGGVCPLPVFPATVPPIVPITAAGPNSCWVVVGGGCTYDQQSATYDCGESNVAVGAVFN